jgi:hypothetical protein
MNRRGFLFGLGAALITAPAIVNASSIMPVKAFAMPRTRLYTQTLDSVTRTTMYWSPSKKMVQWGRPEVFTNDGLKYNDPQEDYFKSVLKHEHEIAPDYPLVEHWQYTEPTVVEIVNEGPWANRLTMQKLVEQGIV